MEGVSMSKSSVSLLRSILWENIGYVIRRLSYRQHCVYLNFLCPGGNYMYYRFNIHQFYVPPTQYIYVFCVDLRTNSDYFNVQV